MRRKYGIQCYAGLSQPEYHQAELYGHWKINKVVPRTDAHMRVGRLMMGTLINVEGLMPGVNFTRNELYKSNSGCYYRCISCLLVYPAPDNKLSHVPLDFSQPIHNILRRFRRMYGHAHLGM